MQIASVKTQVEGMSIDSNGCKNQPEIKANFQHTKLPSKVMHISKLTPHSNKNAKPIFKIGSYRKTVNERVKSCFAQTEEKTS